MENKNVLDVTDLILSVCGRNIGFSTGCKVTTIYTGRITKEAARGSP
ncbi:MAG: hypothetical protein ACI3Z7_05215 [Candidatus Aphodosoma sp.]